MLPPTKRIVAEAKNSTFYPALDGLRAAAVGMVFLVHFLPYQAPWGWLGVQIFFVLSGFLITGILYDTQEDPHRYRNFYIRRTLRIFPLYYALLFAALLLALGTQGRVPEKVWLWFVYLQNFWWLLAHSHSSDVLTLGNGFGIAAIGHLWSLAVEEQFYLLWPVLVFSVRDRRRLMQLCCGLILFRLGLAAYWQIHLPPEILGTGLLYRMLPTQWDGFLEGALLALCLRGPGATRLLSLGGRLAGAALIGYLAIFSVLHSHPAWLHGRRLFDYTSGFESTVGLPLGNLVSACLLLALLQPGSWAYPIFHLRPLRSLGRVSYGLYVFHLPLFVVCLGLLGKVYSRWHLAHGLGAIAALMTTAMTIPAAYLSFYLLEKPFLLLKNRFTSNDGSVEQEKTAHPL